MLTSMCSSEYLSFIVNSGEGYVSPNSCLGLCYFHLLIQGWNRHVKPNIDFNVKIKKWKIQRRKQYLSLKCGPRVDILM